MLIWVNGETLEVATKATVAELLQKLDLTGKRVAVELNKQIVPRSEHHCHEILEDDKLEIVHAIGGG